MSLPVKHSIKKASPSYNYLLFDHVGALNEFVDTWSGQLSDANNTTWRELLSDTRQDLEMGTDWYGTPQPKNVSELETHHVFAGMPLAEKLRPKIKEALARYLEHLSSQVMPKPKVDYNDRGLGMFSFDRAAIGLFRLSRVDVSTDLNRTASQLHIELGRDGLQTSVKKVYAHFKDKESSYPSLRLYIMAGGNADVEGDKMLYVGLSCAELVDFMEARGVAVEVNVLIGTSFQNRINMAVVRVKRFQDKADLNQLLLVSSDPRYFRFRGFKALIAVSDYFGLTVPRGLGKMEKSMGRDFVSAVEDRGFVFEQSYSLEAAAREVSRIVEEYQKRIEDEKRA